MSTPDSGSAPAPVPGGAPPKAADLPPDKIVVRPARSRRNFWPALRREIPLWQTLLWGGLSIVVCVGLWISATRGEPEERLLGPLVLPSPEETYASFHSLWHDRALSRNTLVSLRRVFAGFGLAALVGVPLGVACGCFPSCLAFFQPLLIFGRNIPVAALIPLTFSFFGIGETQKVMFLFIACVAFVISDTAQAIADVSSRYIDTALTLGASRRQVVFKVLFPLALPNILNSLRLLFGLAFGYIMLVELVKSGGDLGGLGDLISQSQRLALQAHIILVLIVIPLVALGIDRCFFWVQKGLFPHIYGGHGLLRQLLRACLQAWEAITGSVLRPLSYAEALQRLGHAAANDTSPGAPSSSTSTTKSTP